jgi:hypothetical protein
MTHPVQNLIYLNASSHIIYRNYSSHLRALAILLGFLSHLIISN